MPSITDAISELIDLFHYHNFAFEIDLKNSAAFDLSVYKLLKLLDCDTNNEIALNEKLPDQAWGGNILHFVIDVLCHCDCASFNTTSFLYVLFKLLCSNKVNSLSTNYYGNTPLQLITYDETLLSYKTNIKFIIFNLMSGRYITKISNYFQRWKQFTVISGCVRKVSTLPVSFQNELGALYVASKFLNAYYL